MFSFCSAQEDGNINEDGLITCAEDEKDSEGRCYEPDDELTGEDKCNCSIRKGLIHWTGKTKCPSQQEICDRGEELLPLL